MRIVTLSLLAIMLIACEDQGAKTKNKEIGSIEDINIPNIGILIFDGFLTSEVTAPLEVFAKNNKEGTKLFNVLLIGEVMTSYKSEEGLQVLADATYSNSPDLDVLFIPSTYDVEGMLSNDRVIDFIVEQNKKTTYTASNCAGAYLIGKSGVADGKKIVTYIGGGDLLQEAFPKLLVQDDAEVSYVEDGKIISSNGNLASYISALKILEKMSNTEHKNYVEAELYLERLQKWRG